MKKTILVTGSSGFLGSALVDELLRKNYKVIGIDKKKNQYLNDKVVNNDNYIFFKEEIDDKLNDLLKDFNIYGIIHLASQQPSSKCVRYKEFYKGNVETTLQLIEIAKEKRVKIIIYTSSCTVLGKIKGRKSINEDTIPNPINYYSLTKYISEKLLEFELRNTGTKTIIIRYPSLMGKNHLGGLAYTYYKLAKKGKVIDVFSNGEKYRNILHINDAVSILHKTIKNIDKMKNYEIFMAGSKNSLTTLEIATKLKDLLYSKSKVLPVNKSPQVDWNVFVDIEKANKLLGFEPMSLSESLNQYIKDLS